MPLPLIPIIFGAVAAGSAAVGIKKGIDAHDNFSEAKSINNEAQSMMEEACTNLKERHAKTQSHISALAEIKIDLYQNSLTPFVDYFKKIKNIDFSELAFDETIANNEEKFIDIANATVRMGEVLAGGATALSSSAITGLAVLGGVKAFGLASTGASIASLSGVAATNATLAWLGGGSLAAGGFGIAGGTLVLGGLIAGPALAIGGLMLANKSQEAVENAYANKSKAKLEVEKMKLAETALKAISKRCKEVTKVLWKLQSPFNDQLELLKELVTKNDNYKTYSLDDKKFLHRIFSQAEVIKKILDMPILTENGELNEASSMDKVDSLTQSLELGYEK